MVAGVWALAAAGALAIAVAPAALATPAAASTGATRLEIVSVSNPRPELVSGGQVLLRVTLPTSAGRTEISANGRDVTSDFAAQPDGSLLGLVSGLRHGANTIVAQAPHERARLDVTDHPITGPVFSGPQQVPFFCETTALGLAPAVQPLCDAPTVVSYTYRTTRGTFAPLADPSQRPADLAMATVGGRSVPYIVRLETGTIDRAAPSPLQRDASWNGRLVYTFGGGCNAGYHQGGSTGGVLDDLFLSQGYAVASSSLNVLDNNCSTIISAEAAMMVKEHFIDTYGPVEHTIGWGGSGGAILQYEIADAYPGILDGIIPGISFPDPISTAGPVTDCRLFDQYFAKTALPYRSAPKQAVSGYLDYESCVSWDQTFANRATATGSCDPAIPLADRWDPVTNPGGIKCNANEQLVNQVGRDPKTGFVRSTLDGVGIQYGLAALDAGQITPAQFADLNANVGGIDVAGNPSPQRTVADRHALAAAYQDDLINGASQGLRTTPIIDQRNDLDLAGFGYDIHTTQWSFVMRDRLLHQNGTAGNQVIIENMPTAAETDAASVYELGAMDQWLTNIKADHSHRSQQDKVLTDKPAGLGDGCYLSADQRVTATLTVPATGPCAALYPVGQDPRIASGESLSMSVLKCRLVPLRFTAYPVTFTPAEQAELRLAFPTGVCDYNLPGVGQRQPLAPWLSYGDENTGLTPPIPLPPPGQP
jgi:hypothetical protein